MFSTHLFGYLLLLTAILFWAGCKNSRINAKSPSQEHEIAQLAQLMTGTFDSSEQASQDSLFFDISLVMVPIWEQDQQAKWLYVEQAVSRAKDRPYRQRVYRISAGEQGSFESRVYALPQESRFIHAWDKPELFAQITPDSLILREGCSVFLTKDGDCYAGSTQPNSCSSTLRGATYATSKVQVCQGQITSWDQGWNDTGEQVWGATTAGYVFKKTD